MTYLLEVQKELVEMLGKLTYEESADVVNYVKGKILESYKNGIEAGKKPKKYNKTSR